jgi:hypothetical protein
MYAFGVATAPNSILLDLLLRIMPGAGGKERDGRASSVSTVYTPVFAPCLMTAHWRGYPGGLLPDGNPGPGRRRTKPRRAMPLVSGLLGGHVLLLSSVPIP